MAIVDKPRATLDDLYLTQGKAELIAGKILIQGPTGHKPSRVAGRISRSLDQHATEIQKGEAFTQTLAYAIPALPSGRESFSPDASYCDGPFPKNSMRFIDGPPKFAAEVRSETDYTATAESEMVEKRADYFLAGTLVVWDVDTLAEVIHVYRASDPEQPTTFRRGAMADAEPAMPGWRVAVDWVFA